MLNFKYLRYIRHDVTIWTHHSTASPHYVVYMTIVQCHYLSAWICDHV